MIESTGTIAKLHKNAEKNLFLHTKQSYQRKIFNIPL